MLISSDSKARCCGAMLIFLAVSMSGPALAQTTDMQAMTQANELGSILAAEEFCGLTYDQDAIQAWITSNVAADAMGFAGTLTMMVAGAEFQQRDMSTSAKTAHCTAIRQTAKHYGFVKD